MKSFLHYLNQLDRPNSRKQHKLLSSLLLTGIITGTSIPWSLVSSAIATSVKRESNVKQTSMLKPTKSRIKAQQKSGLEIIFVDPVVRNIEAYLPKRSSHRVLHELHSKNPLAEMAQVLRSYHDVKAIHIISHGQTGQLILGGHHYDAATLKNYQSELKVIGQALRPGGDILIYGCNIGKTPRLIATLAQLTGADIAASNNPTGDTAQGGDWRLEVATGAIETAAIAVPEWQGLLWTSATPDSTVGWFGDTPALTPNATILTSGRFSSAGANIGATGHTFSMVTTTSPAASVQKLQNVTATTFAQAVTNNDYIYSDLTVGSTGLRVSGLRINQVTSAYNTSASAPLLPTVSGTVFSDADADVTINGSDAGTNAGSANLTIYAIDTAGKVVAKATVAANGTYTLANVPANSNVTLRVSNDSTVAIGATAPTVPSIPSGWYYTGENKNGTVDGAIATLGNIALTTTSSNVTNENFGIRQAYTIAADIAPTTCNPDYRTALNTGITAAGGQVATGANDLNWAAEWIAGPASGPGTPYAPPRPVGVMPAVVVGNLAPGAWINEPSNVRWISYPFRLSVNGNGYHDNADLDGTNGEGNSGFSGPGTSDDVRLKFTSQLTLPSNANTIAISLPVGVAIDNQFVSIKVNGVENLVPTPAANPTAAEYGTLKSVNITNGWQAGVNTIEVIVDSGPDRVGFFLGVQASSTQVCTNPNVLLVKRITAINGDRTKNPNDNTALNTSVDDTTSTRQADDNSPNWKTNYLLGAIDAGKIKPGDEIEYTVYFLNAGSTNANTVRICDRLTANQDFKLGAYGTNKDVQLQLGTSTVVDLTSASDAGDRAELISAGGTVATTCNLKAANDNGTLVIDVTGNTGVPNLTTMPGSTGKGSPNDSYGFLRFVTKVKP